VSELTVAVFDRLPVTFEATLTVIVRMTVAPAARVPIVQVTVPAALAQPPDADTKLVPAGRASLAETPRASEGPLFVMLRL
jgi:hypothetical protein